MEKKISLICLTILLLTSCDKITDQQKIIRFFVKYATPAVKASFSTFTNGYSALIFTYTNGSVSEIITGSPLNAISQNGGNLYTSTPLILPNGYYDFYSISNNSPSPINISFYNGISQELCNGVDYLWASNNAVGVNNGATVSFAYRHLACLINIYITPSINVINLNINYIRFTMPVNYGVAMNLANGTVNSSSSTTALSIVPGSGSTRSFICLPCIAQSQIEVSLNATIDGEIVNNRLYRANINQSYVSGNSYDIILNLNTENSLSLFVSVAPWQNKLLTITY